MAEELQQLLEKIQRDGVDKANAEAAAIVAKAKAEADALVKKAGKLRRIGGRKSGHWEFTSEEVSNKVSAAADG